MKQEFESLHTCAIKTVKIKWFVKPYIYNVAGTPGLLKCERKKGEREEGKKEKTKKERRKKFVYFTNRHFYYTEVHIWPPEAFNH